MICLARSAFEVAAVEGRALLRHQFEHGRGVALVDRVAELVGFLAAAAHDAAAKFALVFFRPFRQFQTIALEVVGAAGVRVDLGGDDVEVSIALVGMRGEERAGVGHAERRKAWWARLLHLLARRLFARPPAKRQVNAILLALFGAAGLVERHEFHDAAGEVGVLAALDREAEILRRRSTRRGYARPWAPCAALPVAGSLPSPRA